MITRDDCLALDEGDPLAPFRSEFMLPAGTIHLGGAGLGPPSRRVRARVDEAMRVEWGADLVRDGGAACRRDLSRSVEAGIARMLNVPPDSVGIAESAATGLRLVLGEALSRTGGGGEVRIPCREGPELADAVRASGATPVLVDIDGGHPTADGAAVLLLGYRDPVTGTPRDVEALNRGAARVGMLTVWELSDAAGITGIDLGTAGVDYAVGRGCGLLNGGPGAPGWFHAGSGGHAAGLQRFPATDISALALAAIDGALALLHGANRADLNWKAATLAAIFLEVLDGTAPGPCDGVVILSHPRARAWHETLASEGIGTELRPDGSLRLAFSPLFLRYADVFDAATILGRVRRTAA